MLRLFFYLNLCLSLCLSLPLYADTEEYRFQQFFPILPQSWYFNEVKDMDVDGDNNVYISDQRNQAVKKFTPDGQLIMQLRMPTDTWNMMPKDIAIDKKNWVYVNYSYNDTLPTGDNDRLLRVFSQNGELLHELSGNTNTLGWAGLAVDSEGFIYVAADVGTNAGIGRISLDSPQPQVEKRWSVLPLPDETMPVKIKNIAINNQDKLYLVDEDNHRIRKYTLDGELIHYWGKRGSKVGQFNTPHDIAIDKNNNVYVTDKLNSRVQKFTAEGEYLHVFANEGHIDDGWGNVITQSPLGKLVRLATNPNVSAIFSNQLPCNSFTSKNCFAAFFLPLHDLDDNFWTRLGATVLWPRDIAVDRKTGEVYVAYYQPENQVRKYTSNGQFINKWSSTKDAFNVPAYVVKDDNDNLYVTEFFRHRVTKVSADGKLLESESWGGIGLEPGHFFLPSGIARDSQGHVYVVDTGNARVQKFDSEGNFIAILDGFDKSLTPLLDEKLIEIISSKDYFALSDYLLDIVRSNEQSEEKIALRQFVEELNVYFFDAVIKGIDFEFGFNAFLQAKLVDSEYRGFILPVSIAIDQKDQVYITDIFKSQVFKFDTQGNLIGQFGRRAPVGTVEPQNDEFYMPLGIATDVENRVYVTDIYAHKIKIFDEQGHFLTQYGEKGREVGQLYSPTGITVDDMGNVYVTEAETRRVQKLTFTQNGVQNLQIGSYGTGAGQFSQPMGITVNADGSKVFVVDGINNRIQRFDQANFNTGKAIIVVGWLEGSDDLQNNLQTLANFAYRTLLQKGFRAEEIRYLSPNLGLDLNDDGLRDVYAISTLETVKEAIQWAADSDNLTLYLLDHGRADNFRINAHENLSAETLKNLLTVNTTIIYEACESGSFVYKLANIASKNLILITSAASTQTASLPGEGALSFSSYFWREIANGADIRQAFEAGQYAMGEQAPQINANGNTQANEPADLAAVENRHIGNPNPARSGNSPEITNLKVAPDNLTETSIATVSADVHSNYPITKVIALVRPPLSVQRSGDPVLDFPEFRLDFVEKQRYAANYDGFTRNGEYQLTIYAFDTHQRISQPISTIVTVAGHRKRPKALVIGGVDAAASDLQGAVNALKNQAYKEIELHAVDNTGGLPIDAQTSGYMLEQALNPLNQQDASELVVYLEATVILNTTNAPEIVLNSTENISASTLAVWLDKLQDALDIPLTVILGGERTGLLPPVLAKENRIVISSTGPDGTTTNCPAMREFSRLFWTHVFYGVTDTYDAFVKTKIEFDALIDEFCEPTNNQTELNRWLPRLSANGKQLQNADEKHDAIQYTSAHNLTSGVITASNTPFISALPSNIFLNHQNQLTLRVPAVSNAGHAISRVWAEIIPYDTALQPIAELELFPDVTCGYVAKYDALQASAPYFIRYHAEDSAGEQAPPVLMRLNRQTSDPTQPLLSQNIYQTCQQLHLELPTLTEGYKRYLAAQFPDGTLVALSEPNQFVPLNMDALHTIPIWPHDAMVALDMPISPDFPTGEYTFYQVDIPQNATLSPDLIKFVPLKAVSFQLQ